MARSLLEIGKKARGVSVGGHPLISRGLWAADNQAVSQLGVVASVAATRPNSSLSTTAVENIVNGVIREKQLTRPADVKRILGQNESDDKLRALQDEGHELRGRIKGRNEGAALALI